MATLAEIANEVNRALSQIESNTKETSDTVARLEGTHARIEAGFAFLGEGLFAILEAQREANAHLATQVDQNDVVLCALTQHADLLCRQLRRHEQSLAIDHDVLAALRTLEDVLGLVHARELVEHQRQRALEAKLAEGSPSRSEPAQACVEPCRDPKVRTHDPRGQDWDGQWKPQPSPQDRSDQGDA